MIKDNMDLKNINKKNSKIIKYLHLIIILVGIIFISLPIFHSNMWFDESYSVALAKHSFKDIWLIGGNDVHPILYYFCLHILYLIFGSNLIVYRIFSMITIALLAIVGYTHIRKDFGEKEGLIFSFLTLFLPVASQYSGEIRMYSLGMLLGTLMAIYAFRIYRGKINKSTFILFGIFSLLTAYTHYYGLMLAGIVNLLLFIYLIKNNKTRKKDLKYFIITAVIQVILYLPWLVSFLVQLSNVSKGFWISLSFPGTLYEILTMQFKGNLSVAPIILTTLFYCYITYLVLKTKKEDRIPATWCFKIYLGIILIALFISLCMHSVILLYRYLLIITGLLIFGFSYFMVKDNNKNRVIAICAVILVLSITSNISLIRESYNADNRNFINYINENIKEDDIIVYSDVINGAVVTTEISQKNDNVSYFYNKDKWNVEKAYKAFSPYMEIKDSIEEILDNYKGRIWIIEGKDTHNLYDEINNKYSIKKIEEKQFNNKYKNNYYTIELIEK